MTRSPQESKLANLDLNLLVSLDALLAERSVSRAAERLSLSQPSLSASLARLRRHFRDDLLVRVGNRYELTPLAAQLAEQTASALAAVARVFASEPDFDPATAEREFTVLISDYAITVLGPPLAALLQQAPHVRLRLHQVPIPVGDVAPPPGIVRGLAAEYITGLVGREGKTIIVLHTGKLLASKEKLALQAALKEQEGKTK